MLWSYSSLLHFIKTALEELDHRLSRFFFIFPIKPQEEFRALLRRQGHHTDDAFPVDFQSIFVNKKICLELRRGFYKCRCRPRVQPRAILDDHFTFNRCTHEVLTISASANHASM